MIATPITLPRAFTIALPDAPWPPPPIKSTLGGPHSKTFVLQSGRVGDAGIALPIFSISSAKLLSWLNPELARIPSKLSSTALATPFFAENAVGSGQFKLSQSRTFVIIFANLIPFLKASLGTANPPPLILFSCSNIEPKPLSIALSIWPNISPRKFSIPQAGTSKTWPIMFSKLLDR